MTQAYINSLKPRPHFEDVVFGKRKRTQLIYPDRAYIIRDSLFYGFGDEDKEKLKNEERVKMMESNLKLIGQEVSMTLPQSREIMKSMLGSELPGKLKVAFDKHRETAVREIALKSQDKMMKELGEKAKEMNALRLKKKVMEGLKGHERDEKIDEAFRQGKAALKIQGLMKDFMQTPKGDPRFPSPPAGDEDALTIGDAKERLENVLNISIRPFYLKQHNPQFWLW